MNFEQALQAIVVSIFIMEAFKRLAITTINFKTKNFSRLAIGLLVNVLMVSYTHALLFQGKLTSFFHITHHLDN